MHCVPVDSQRFSYPKSSTASISPTAKGLEFQDWIHSALTLCRLPWGVWTPPPLVNGGSRLRRKLAEQQLNNEAAADMKNTCSYIDKVRIPNFLSGPSYIF